MVSEEIIGDRITEIVSAFVPVFNSEAETEIYPYAVYEQDVTHIRDKAEIRGYSSSLTLAVYSKDYDEARTIMLAVRQSVDGGMGTGMRAIRTGSREECIIGVWSIQDTYTIRQINSLISNNNGTIRA